jgi:spore coat protein U-like protein
MSIYRSYFNKSNTLIYNSYTNTARNPIVELFYGRVNNLAQPIGYSRYIFNIDLYKVTEKIKDKKISTGCTNFSNITHTLRMKNTSFFDKDFRLVAELIHELIYTLYHTYFLVSISKMPSTKFSAQSSA